MRKGVLRVYGTQGGEVKGDLVTLKGSKHLKNGSLLFEFTHLSIQEAVQDGNNKSLVKTEEYKRFLFFKKL